MFVKPYKLKWLKLKEIEMEYSDKVEHIKSMNVGIVYPLCVFFCNVIKGLHPHIEDYLVKQMSEARAIMEKELNELKTKNT
jgi:hypothetical protein